MAVDQRGRVSRRQMIQASGAAALGGFAVVPFGTTSVAAQGAWDRETDVVVVGTGAAGTPAAIEAARAGAQVLRLEKVEAVGGNMSHSQGIMYLGGGTDLQKKHGFEDTVEGMIAYMEAWMSPWEDPAFIRFYAENSVEHYNWLVGEGVPYGQDYYPEKVVNPPDGVGGLSYCGNEGNYPYNEITTPIPRGHCVTGYGAALSKALQASADAEPNITTEVNAPVHKLIVNQDGRVIGVVAEIAGQEQHILARKGVILASGGYDFNEDMLTDTYAPALDMTGVGSAYRGNTGDGIRMAAALGARLRNMDQTASFMFVYPPEEKCQGILVSSSGRRFQNESDYGAVAGHRLVYHLDGISWLIMDQAVADTVTAVGGDVSDPYAVADTIEELAIAIGVPAEILGNELAFYNERAAVGEDPVFHKDTKFLTPLETAPYMAFPFNALGGGFMTTGSVQIDLQTHVLDMEGEPIPGLYAAGVNGAGIGRRFYNSGVRLGEGTFFGRVAGREAAVTEPWTGEAETVRVTNTTAVFAHVPDTNAGTPEASPVPGSEIVTVEAVDIAYTQTELSIAADTAVAIQLTNNGVIPHDFAIEGTDFKTPLANSGETVTLNVTLPAGEYVYFCTVPGHREAGMEGTLTVE